MSNLPQEQLQDHVKRHLWAGAQHIREIEDEIDAVIDGLLHKCSDVRVGYTPPARVVDDVAKHLPYLARKMAALRRAVEAILDAS